MNNNTMIRMAEIGIEVARRGGGASKAEWDLVKVLSDWAEVIEAQEQFISSWEEMCGPVEAKFPDFPAEALDFFPDAMRPIMDQHCEDGDSHVVAAYLNQLAMVDGDEEADAIIGKVKEWAAQLTLGQRARLVVHFEEMVSLLQDMVDRAEDDPSIEDIEEMAIRLNRIVASHWLLGRLECADLICRDTESAWNKLRTRLHDAWEARRTSTKQGSFKNPVLNTLAEISGAWWTVRPNSPILPDYTWYNQEEYEYDL